MTARDRRAPKKLTPAQRVQLGLELREQYEKTGVSIRGLAALRGWSYGFVSTLLHEAGTAIRAEGWATGRPRPAGRVRPTVRDVERLRGLLKQACDALPDRELADQIRQEGGLA